MRKVLVLLMLLLPVAAFCKDKKHKPLKLPVSRWREVTRMGFDSSIIPFQDTFFVTFLKKDSFSYHNLNGFVYNGGYTINEDSLLDFGTARFKIAVKRPNMLVLEDDKARYVLAPNPDTIALIVLDTNDNKAAPVANIDQMIGHWTVYKRQAKEGQMGVIDPATSITAAYITGPSTDGKLGYIYGGQDAKNNPSWYIKSFGIDQVLECDGKGLRVLKVIKCLKGELVLEESDVRYYFKQFK